MAPECVRGESYSSAVDVWAVGAVAFQCLTGYPPFLGDTTEEIFDSILNHRVRYDWPEFHKCGDLAVPLLQLLLTPDPLMRPSASAALRHRGLTRIIQSRKRWTESPRLCDRIGQAPWPFRRIETFSVAQTRISIIVVISIV